MKNKKPQAKFLTAMLIDDNEVDNFIDEKMIEGCNIAERTLVHTDSRSALDYIKNVDKNGQEDLIPDIIFLDINMPIMDGFQFMKEFEEMSDKVVKKSKIVILTTSLNPADMVYCETKEYVIGYINKPLTREFLETL